MHQKNQTHQKTFDPGALTKYLGRALRAATSSLTKSRTCMICTRFFELKRYLHQPCPGNPQHVWCSFCLQEGIRTAFYTRSRLQCCSEIPLWWIKQWDPYQEKYYRVKVWEPTSPNVAYCSKTCCNAFIGNEHAVRNVIQCRKCGTKTCAKCKEQAHPEETCNVVMTRDENKGEFMRLARRKGWRCCPRCGIMIEKTNPGRKACPWVTCRYCRQGFEWAPFEPFS